MSKRYDSGEFSQAEYIEIAKKWTQLLDDFGGYPDLPFDESTEQVIFSEVFELPGMTEQTIYDRVIEWGAISFGSIKDVLRHANLELCRWRGKSRHSPIC